MIDVIIPAYNSHKYIDNLLSILSLQTIKDKIKVTIVNDGSNNNYAEFIDFYKEYIDINELSYKENKGPGYARKYGINHTNNKYIVFIDSDDVLYDRYALEHLYNAITSNDYDYVNSLFYEEYNNSFIKKEEDNIWLHGKIYKREFLEKNDINFNDTRSNEDNGFNTLVLLSKPKTRYIVTPTYIWRSNMNSITRSNNYDYQYKGLLGFIENITWALEKKKKDISLKKDISKIALQSLYYIYLCYLHFYNKYDSFNLIDKSYDLYQFYLLYDFSKFEYLRIIDDEYKKSSSSIDTSVALDPIITFRDFLRKIGESHD